MTLGAALAAPQSADDVKNLELYEKKIRPIFIEHCYECHGPNAKKLEAGLRLDSPEGWLRGGESGPAIVPGKPNESRLIRAIHYVDHDLEMPPTGKLPPEQIAAMEEWVLGGAHAPDRSNHSAESKPTVVNAGSRPAEPHDSNARILDRAKGHWAFQPYTKPAPPGVHNKNWIRNDLDNFILADLEASGLEPAPEADRRVWLRRVTWDLTGLPPTESELEQFLADKSTQAFDAVVDRLLASTAYGERQARVWLDVARYADSNGLDENLALENAWRYRDYVISSFNADKPYNTFVTEQLAGDLLPEPADKQQLRDRLTATGFLVLGPKMLAEQDKEKLLMDTVDEQVDVTTKTFLGLTGGCARCHDHKFDPIPTQDYYALAGVFRSTSTFENTAFVSRWRQLELANAASRKSRDEWNHAHDAAEAEWKKRTHDSELILTKEWRRNFARYLVAATEALRDTILVEAEDFSRGTLGVDKETWGNAETVIVRTTTTGPQFVEYDITVAKPLRHQLWVRMASQESRPMKVSVDGDAVEGAALSNTTGSFYPDGQMWVQAATVTLKAGRNVVRLEGTVASMPHLDAIALAPIADGSAEAPWPNAESVVFGKLEAVEIRQFLLYLTRAARAKNSIFNIWNRAAALPPGEFTKQIPDLWVKLRDERDKQTLTAPAALLSLLDAPAPSSLPDLASRYQAVVATVDAEWSRELQTALQQKREAPKALANLEFEQIRQVCDGSAGAFAVARRELELLFSKDEQSAVAAARKTLDELEKSKPMPFDRALGVAEGTVADLPVHIRGSHLNKSKESTPRGFLHALDAALPQPTILQKSSGRLELAAWITDPRNPLTARVMVNRIWQGHFGEGIVRSPSNFGLRGETPSNLILLNWLACTFVERGWSVKSIHRLIATSAAYRMSSTWNALGAQKDPEDRHLWRMPRRRLDAESIRDSLLAVAGKLDRTMGGSLLMIKDGEYVTNDQSRDQARYSAPRRTIYLPIIRNAMYDLYTTFDYNDSSVSVDRRPATTSAHQSLFLLNSPLALSVAEAISADVQKTDASDDRRIVTLWKRVYSRVPSDRELERASAFLAQARSLERGADPPVTAGGGESKSDAPADPQVHKNTPGEVEQSAWRGLCQALIGSNEFLFVD